MPSLHCLQHFQPSKERVRKAPFFQQPYSIAWFQSSNCWRAEELEAPSPAERVGTRFGLGDTCCPRGDEGGWTWQSASAKCCLVPAPWVEKSSFCSPFPGEMAQEKVHALITLKVPGWASTREGSWLQRRSGCARLRHVCRGEAIPILDVSEACPRGSETTLTASSIQQFTVQLCLLMLPLPVLGLILSIPLDNPPCAPGV